MTAHEDASREHAELRQVLSDMLDGTVLFLHCEDDEADCSCCGCEWPCPTVRAAAILGRENPGVDDPPEDDDAVDAYFGGAA